MAFSLAPSTPSAPEKIADSISVVLPEDMVTRLSWLSKIEMARFKKGVSHQQDSRAYIKLGKLIYTQQPLVYLFSHD